MKKFLNSLLKIWIFVGLMSIMITYVAGCVLTIVSDMPDKTKIIILVVYLIATTVIYAFVDSRDDDEEE